MMIDTQYSRESRMISVLGRYVPGLVLHSRAGEGLFGSPVPRLRFDRALFLGWFWKLFLNAGDRACLGLVMTITGSDFSMLTLQDGFCDIEIHCFDHRLADGIERFAVQYRKETGKLAVLILESPERVSCWRPVKRFLIVALALAALFVAARLLVTETVINLFRHFF